MIPEIFEVVYGRVLMQSGGDVGQQENNVLKWNNVSNNGPQEERFGSFDRKQDGDNNGVGFVETSKQAYLTPYLRYIAICSHWNGIIWQFD